MPRRLLDSAIAYYRAGARCSEEPDLGSPGPVNNAFSVELYLKLLILLTKGKTERGHDLHKELYRKLPRDVRDRLLPAWTAVNWPSCETEETLIEKIRNAAKVFEQWRYSFEHEFLALFPDDLRKFARTLHALVKEFAPSDLLVPDTPEEPNRS
jgi:hypothetical protein